MPPGENPVDLAVADLDEDGLADLAVANHETDHVTLLFDDRSPESVRLFRGRRFDRRCPLNPPAKPCDCRPQAQPGASTHSHPLDELLTGTAFEKCVGHPVDVISAG